MIDVTHAIRSVFCLALRVWVAEGARRPGRLNLDCDVGIGWEEGDRTGTVVVRSRISPKLVAAHTLAERSAELVTKLWG